MKLNTLLISALVYCHMGILTSCSSSDDMPGTTPADALIELNSRLVGMDGVSSRGAGPINGTGSVLNISLFRADESYGTAYPASNPVSGVITATGKINAGMYYQDEAEKKTKLLGLYPAVNGTTVTWSAAERSILYPALDGSTDVICSTLTEGSYNNPMSTMSFSHLLTMIRVNVVCTTEASGKWGKVNSVSLIGKRQDCVVTLPAPNTNDEAIITGAGAASDLPVTTATGGTPAPVTPATTAKLFGQAMFLPVTTAAAIQLSIVTDDGTFVKPIASQQYEAGKAYEITLIFKADEVITSAVSIAAWGDGGSQNIDI